MVLATGPLFDGLGLAVPSLNTFKDDKELIGKGYRNLFVTPWRDGSLVGTFYDRFDKDPDDMSVSEQEVRGFIQEFNQAYPNASLRYEDIRFVFAGLLPEHAGSDTQGDPVCEKKCRLIDHSTADGTSGLITVMGVKWTTARGVAEDAVDLACAQLNTKHGDCRTATHRLPGAPESDPAADVQAALRHKPDWASPSLIQYLYGCYGNELGRVIALAEQDPPLRSRIAERTPAILAQVVFAAREEMAMTLPDVIFQRIPIGFNGWMGDVALKHCAQLMGKELGWTCDQTQQMVEAVIKQYRARGISCEVSTEANEQP